MANDDAVLNGVSGRPLELLARWLAEADARAFTLATASADGTPHARTVLATGVDDTSVRFTTSLPPDEARTAYAERSPNLRALAWVYEELGGQAVVDPDEVRALFDRHRDRDPAAPPPSWTTFALRPDRVEAWWMPDGAGVATRVRFDRSGGEWTRQYVLP